MARLVGGRARAAPHLRVSTGEIATNNAHLGLGVAAAERAASLKPRFGRSAYAIGGLVAGVRHGATAVSVEVDGRTLHDGPAAVVFVALGQSAGGGHELSDEVELLDAVADVFVVTATNLLTRLRLVRHMATHDLPSAPSVCSDRGSEIVITLQRETTAEVDGEFRAWSGTVSLTVQSRAWTVIAERDSPVG